MNAQLLYDGLKAMILGMGMVYLFLIIMILVMKLTSKLLAPYAGFLEEKKPAPAKKAQKKALAATDDSLAKAVAEAALIYKKSGKTTQDAISVSSGDKNIIVNIAPGTAAPAAPAAKQAEKASAGEVEVTSPLPGTVMRIEVAEGHVVFAGDVLAVIEAMKMETEIRSAHAGIVQQVLVSSGDVVTAGQAIFTIGVEK